MQNNIQFTEKEQVFFKKYLGEFDTPKKINRSAQSIPQETIDKIESGIIESADINFLKNKYPVFTYKTCLTIHGNFPEICRNRIGGYKNILQNKNGSLEIRYSAIDYQKRKDIKNYLGYKNEWNTKENSTDGIFFEKSKVVDSKEIAINILSGFSEYVKNFNIEGLKANVYSAGFNYWGRYYIYIVVKPLIIEGDALNIASKLLNVPENDILERIKKEDSERNEREQLYKLEREQREQRKANAAERISQYPKKNIQPIQGSVYIAPVICNNGMAAYRFFKVEKIGSFKRLVLSSYLSKDPIFEAEKLAEYRKGKQLKVSEISAETYLIN